MSKFRYQNPNRPKKLLRRAFKTGVIAAFFILLVTISAQFFGFFQINNIVSFSKDNSPPARAAQPVVEIVSEEQHIDQQPSNTVMDKKVLASLIGSVPQEVDQRRIMDIIDQKGNRLYVLTTLDPDLQAKAMRWVKASRAHSAALVAMNPDNGEVLALAGYHAGEESANAALEGSFPAASLFKIVTAAAALEAAEMSPDSKVSYDGGKHTLFKGNVIKDPSKGGHAATLKDSFAESINTVFGKLGAFTLGSKELEDFAGRFGFNGEISFELPVEPSSFSVEDENDPFNLAELASGFNRSTKVSPLHGAMMASIVISGGKLREPTFVKEVFDLNNHIYYQPGLNEPRQAISRETASELVKLMQAAVENGTGRRTFGGAKKDPVLSKLIIGGKSGTINNDAGNRVDWFVAWSNPKDRKSPKLALSAVVVHGGGTATTSQKLIYNAIKFYYSPKKFSPK